MKNFGWLLLVCAGCSSKTATTTEGSAKVVEKTTATVPTASEPQVASAPAAAAPIEVKLGAGEKLAALDDSLAESRVELDWKQAKVKLAVIDKGKTLVVRAYGGAAPVDIADIKQNGELGSLLRQTKDGIVFENRELVGHVAGVGAVMAYEARLITLEGGAPKVSKTWTCDDTEDKTGGCTEPAWTQEKSIGDVPPLPVAAAPAPKKIDASDRVIEEDHVGPITTDSAATVASLKALVPGEWTAEEEGSEDGSVPVFKHDGLEVWENSGKIAMIEISDDTFATPAGRKVGDKVAVLRDTYTDLKCEHSDYEGVNETSCSTVALNGVAFLVEEDGKPVKMKNGNVPTKKIGSYKVSAIRWK